MTTKAKPRRRVRVSDAGNPLHRLADLIAERRIALALTQADVAALAGVGTAAVHKLENGQPTLLPVALSVLDALGLSVAIAPPRELPPLATLPSAQANT